MPNGVATHEHWLHIFGNSAKSKLKPDLNVFLKFFAMNKIRSSF